MDFSHAGLVRLILGRFGWICFWWGDSWGILRCGLLPFPWVGFILVKWGVVAGGGWVGLNHLWYYGLGSYGCTGATGVCFVGLVGVF